MFVSNYFTIKSLESGVCVSCLSLYTLYIPHECEIWLLQLRVVLMMPNHKIFVWYSLLRLVLCYKNMNYTTFHIVRKGEGKIVMKVATCIWHVEYIWWYEMYISYHHEWYHNIVWLLLKMGYFSDKFHTTNDKIWYSKTVTSVVVFGVTYEIIRTREIRLSKT